MIKVEGKMSKILLVEDNPDDVDLTMIALEEKSIAGEVAMAHDGSPNRWITKHSSIRFSNWLLTGWC
jgi:hypothetical protein